MTLQKKDEILEFVCFSEQTKNLLTDDLRKKKIPFQEDIFFFPEGKKMVISIPIVEGGISAPMEDIIMGCLEYPHEENPFQICIPISNMEIQINTKSVANHRFANAPQKYGPTTILNLIPAEDVFEICSKKGTKRYPKNRWEDLYIPAAIFSGKIRTFDEVIEANK